MKRLSILLMLGLVLASSGGCTRLSDPFYTFKPLEVPDEGGPGWSVLFGRLRLDAWPSPDSFDKILFERIGPGPARVYGASQILMYRAMRPRMIKDGYFVVVVPPGVYELDRAAVFDYGIYSSLTLVPDEEIRAQRRVVVTRPGIYDLGDLMVHSGWDATVESEMPEDEAARKAVLRRAVEGTPWERYLDRPVAPQARR